MVIKFPKNLPLFGSPAPRINLIPGTHSTPQGQGLQRPRPQGDRSKGDRSKGKPSNGKPSSGKPSSGKSSIAQIPPRPTAQSLKLAGQLSPKVNSPTQHPSIKINPADLRPTKWGWKRQSQWPRWVAPIGLVSAASGLAVSGWLGVQLIINPQSLLWVNRIVPNWIPLPVTGLKPPQPLDDIRKELQAEGKQAGTPLVLGNNKSFVDKNTAVTDLLLPVIERLENCTVNCDRIVEVRLYQTTPFHKSRKPGVHYQLLDQIGVSGPDEGFALGHLASVNAAEPGGSQPLPLASVTKLEGKSPTQGIWVNLQGELPKGDRAIRYGRLVQYLPQTLRLNFQPEWSTTQDQGPTWQQVTGSPTPEVLVNQSIGFEPQFALYQLRPNSQASDPAKLSAVELSPKTINDGGYRQALQLAKAGLWSQSHDKLKALRPALGKAWNASAQAQLDLVGLHAQAAQAQANQTWASIGEQVVVNLIDGRWQRALDLVQAKPEHLAAAAELLQADAARLSTRIDTALQVSPSPAVRTWGALIIATKSGPKDAVAWLKKQKGSSAAEVKTVEALVKKLETTASGSDSSLVSTTSQVFGEGALTPGANPADWRRPKTVELPKLTGDQTWFTVTASGFFDGKGWKWGGSPQVASSNKTESLWKRFGLENTPYLQLVSWSPSGEMLSTSLEVKGFRMGGAVQFLGLGSKLEQSKSGAGFGALPLAFTEGAVQWTSGSSDSVSGKAQSDPTWAKAALPVLVRELKQAGLVPQGVAAKWEALEEIGLGQLSVQLISLSGRKQPEVIITIDGETLNTLKDVAKPSKAEKSGEKSNEKSLEKSSEQARPPSRPKTLIFSPTGQLLHSELSIDAGSTFLAIADLGDLRPPVLVVANGGRYQLQRWSSSSQSFVGF
jgi:hypothetical protein